jgi:hypothetical protein
MNLIGNAAVINIMKIASVKISKMESTTAMVSKIMIAIELV